MTKKSKFVIPSEEKLKEYGLTAAEWKKAETRKENAKKAQKNRDDLKKLREDALVLEKIKSNRQIEIKSLSQDVPVMIEPTAISKKRKSEHVSEDIMLQLKCMQDKYDRMYTLIIEKFNVIEDKMDEVIYKDIANKDRQKLKSRADEIIHHDLLQSYILPDISIKIESKDD